MWIYCACKITQKMLKAQYSSTTTNYLTLKISANTRLYYNITQEKYDLQEFGPILFSLFILGFWHQKK